MKSVDKNEITMGTFIIPTIVKVRKYDVNTEKLKQLLCDSRKKNNISVKQISKIMNLPLTLVQHWFRTDKCFAIPDAEYWLQLKKYITN